MQRLDVIFVSRVSMAYECFLGLTYLATNPAYERRGAGALLVQWGLDRCRREQVRAYVESTSLAEPVYTRLGFEARETISTVCKGGNYDRIVLVYRP